MNKLFLLTLVLFSLSIANSIKEEVSVCVSLQNLPFRYKDSAFVTIYFDSAINAGLSAQYVYCVGSKYDGGDRDMMTYKTPKGIKIVVPVRVRTVVTIGNGGNVGKTIYTKTIDTTIFKCIGGDPVITFRPYRHIFKGKVVNSNGTLIHNTKIEFHAMNLGKLVSDTGSFIDSFRVIPDIYEEKFNSRCINLLYNNKSYQFIYVYPIAIVPGGIQEMFRCCVYGWDGIKSFITDTFTFNVKDSLIKATNFIFKDMTSVTQTSVNHPVLSTHIQPLTYDLKGKRIPITKSTALNLFVTNKHSKIIINHDKVGK